MLSIAEINKLKKRWTRMNQRTEQQIWQKRTCKRMPRNQTQLSRQKLFAQKDIKF